MTSLRQRVALAVACTAAGCQHNEDLKPLAVFAASSLAEAFGDLERSFEAANPEVDVQLTLAGSQVLRLQIERGAQADVFASANPGHVDSLAQAGLVAEPVTLAYNELVVITPSHDDAIESFADLQRARRIVVGDQGVPVGLYTTQLLQRTKDALGRELANSIETHIVSTESNVRLVRAKVELGEADAAVVYRTDAASSTRVRVIEIPPDVNVRARYPIARVTHTKRPDLARAFVTFALTNSGQAILRRRGFKTESR